MLSVQQSFATEAQHLLDEGNAMEAAQQLEKGLLHYPDYTTAYVVLARAYQTLNDNESAYEVTRRALKRFPGHRVLTSIESELQPMLLRKSAEQLNVGATASTGIHITHDSLSSKAQSVTVSEASVIAATADSAVVSSDDSGASSSDIQSSAEQEGPKPEPNDTDTLLDDGLSNIDDDNDNWPELREIVEDDGQVESEEQHSTETVRNALNNAAVDEVHDRVNDSVHDRVNDRLNEGLSDTLNDDLTLQDDDADSNAQEDEDPSILIKKINVVHGSVVVDQSLLKRLRIRSDQSNLRFIDTASSDKATHRSLRSSNMRLVPGLEFTPLRVQSMRKHTPRNYSFAEPPAFPVIRGSDMNISPIIAPSPEKEAKKRKGDGERRLKTEVKRTQLEELAARLERARIPVVTEDPEPGFPRFAAGDTSEPMVISETMAGIYEQQGLYEQAIKAYRQLARIKPEKLEYFEQKIALLAKKPE